MFTRVAGNIGRRVKGRAGSGGTHPEEGANYPFQVTNGSAFLNHGAIRQICFHGRVSCSPEGGRFRVEPDESLAPLVKQFQDAGLRISVVISGIAQDKDRSLICDRVKPGLFKISKYLAIIGPA
jgi:hypothetical protein